MNKVKVIIEKGKDHYSAFVSEGLENHAISGTGQTEIEAINDLHVALEELREMHTEEDLDDFEVPSELIDLLFEYSYNSQE